jgi:acid phosphatase family membrane protein YuiD
LRGSGCYLIAAVIANIMIKPLVDRRRPQGADQGRITPVTSSFPSGHTASNSAFVVGVAQELPLLTLPLGAVATVAHWSLIHSNKHHLTDVLAGGAIGLSVAQIMGKWWPPDTSPVRSWCVTECIGSHASSMTAALTLGRNSAFLGAEVRLGLPSHPASRRRSCLRLGVSTPLPPGDFHPKRSPMPGVLKRADTARTRRRCTRREVLCLKDGLEQLWNSEF